MTELADLTAAELADAYQAGDCTPPEVVAAVRARIEQWEPTINAIWYRDDAGADAQAAAAAERWRTGRPLSPLDGVPVTLKENVATEGVPTPLGPPPPCLLRRHVTPRPPHG